jgi:hypothetical protein
VRVAGQLTVIGGVVSGNSTIGALSEGGGLFGYGVAVTDSLVSANSTAGGGRPAAAYTATES